MAELIPLRPRKGTDMSPARGAPAPSAEQPAELSDALLQLLSQPGPRYTSYPTADRFVEAFGPLEARQALRQRADGAVAGGVPPLSLYVHVPFCEQVCYYCACNKVVTRHHDRATPFLAALEREMDLVVEQLGAGQQVVQLHLGGGSPTFLSDAEMGRLVAAIERRFHLAHSAERSIEVDPRTADRTRLARLRELGFNRLSFGVQDVDPAVQRAVHRVQPFELVQALVAEARALRYESINVDLICGLPLQTAASFANTVAQVASLRPHRIALYSYAHLPQRFKPQRRIDEAQLPGPQTKVEMLRTAISGFIAQGWQYIGMDHFALPDDALAVAKRQGRLHRNFQGYSTLPDCDLIGLGPSAISKVGATYSQNAKTIPEYQDTIAQGELPIVRGLALTRDDLLRRSVIMALMCQGEVDFEAIELSHLIDFKRTFAAELLALQPLAEAGLVEVGDRHLQLTAKGWFGVRAIAAQFDRQLQADRVRERYSRII
jgi:oxygen-independent coproporphyrinogen-3 oxidase